MVENYMPKQRDGVVFRQEQDDWAILFDPENGNTFGLDPVSVLIWKRLDGEHTLNQIVEDLKKECKDVPPEANEHVESFVLDLERNNLLSN